jgi:MoaA/NifB/PqqE/SkfB family radical SAM enzyme
MFKFSELKEIHLEITNNCQASCPMCPRNINGGLENPLIKKTSWTFEDFKIIMNSKVLNQIKGFYMAGDFGDAMLNDDLIDMCQYATDTNPNLYIHIHTNGGARKVSWWESLAKALPKDHIVVFAIDGLEDTHSTYRIGIQYENVIRNAQAFIKAGGIAEWAFLKFKHNEHQIDEIKRRSKNLGFKYLSIKNSSRFLLDKEFPVLDKNGKVIYHIEPSTDTPIRFVDKNTINNWSEYVKSTEIECHVLDYKSIYIDAHKNLYACCFLGNVPYADIPDDITKGIRQQMLEQNDNMIKQIGEINLLKKSIEDILNSQEYHDVWQDMWYDNKSHMCARTCGKHKNLENTSFWEEWQDRNSQ